MKTYSHDALSVKAAAWINSRTTASGLRLGFEVQLSTGYVADVAALGWWQARHCEEYGIYGPMVRVPDPDYPGGTRPDRQFLPSVPSLLFVVESKATRSDFLSTFNDTEHHANRKTAIGSLHWCVTNHNICKASELPDFWGLLVPRGSGLIELRKPRYCETDQTLGQVYKCGYTLLWKNEWRGRMFDALQILAAEVINAEQSCNN